jgi:histidinol-phosphate aminotransferase
LSLSASHPILFTMSANPLWSTGIAGLSPYTPGEQPAIEGLIKLNTNEHPHGPSPAALAAIRAATDDTLRLYPDPDARALKAEVARQHGLGVAQVFVGNGSDEVLAHAFRALLKHPLPILFPDVSYSFYPVYAELFGIEVERVPLAEDFSIDLAAYARPNGGIVLANPNAPTGRALSRAQIRALLQGNRASVVVIDEAYVDFGAESAVPLIAEFPNLLVVHTLSKSRALAGLRVGFAMGHPSLIEALERVKGCFNSYPLDRLAQAGAVAALADVDWFERTRQQVVASRAVLSEGLQARGFEVLPSAANFVFARHPGWRGATLLAALRERRILVRQFDKPRISDFLRITVGTPEQVSALLNALDALLLPQA